MLRPATLIDIPAMVALGQAMHAESRHAVLRWNAEKVAALIASLIGMPDGLALVAVRDGQIVGGFLGFVAAHFASDDRVSCDLALYVAPDRRGGIAAAQLLKAYASWAKARGAVQIQIGVTTGVNVAATSKLFAAVGFEPVGNLFEFRG